ncbi:MULTISPECIES: hypothetical protein [Bacillus]|nr:hypothetical protein [Bacillus smithii]
MYEYYHAGDPMRIEAVHYLTYQKDHMLNMVERALARNEDNKVFLSC